MQYVMRRVKTNKLLNHLFEDNVDKLFTGDNVMDAYRYDNPIIAQDVAKNLAISIREPVEILGVELDTKTGKINVVEQGLVYGL
jgi:hypothetical protein